MTDDELPTPLPLVSVTDDEVQAAVFPSGSDLSPDTPFGAAVLWWLAVLEPEKYAGALSILTTNPPAWDFAQVSNDLAGWSMAQNPIMSEERPDLAYMKMIEVAGEMNVQAFEDVELTDAYILTLVLDSGQWSVWGLSKNYLPPADVVFID